MATNGDNQSGLQNAGANPAEWALHQANLRLEAEVARRTRELSTAVDTLLQEVSLRTRVEQELRQRSQQLRQLASELTLAEQRERRRLAEVLHDNLQQLLVGAKLRLSMLERSGDPAVRATTEAVEDLLDESIRCSRSLTAELSPPILHEGGLVSALEWLAVWVRRKHALRVELVIDSQAEPPCEEMKVLLFQSARELLFNTVKHAGVRSARMRLARSGGELVLTVSDDGAGFDPAGLACRQGGAGGFGLFSIRERLDLLGGRLEIESCPGGGSRFRMFAPLGVDVLESDARTEGYDDISITGLTALADAAVEAAEASRQARDTIRILLVDDHAVVRQGLSRLIGEEPDMEIAGEAADGQMAVEMVRRVRPDVVMMDISMPKMGGIEATRIIRARHPEVRVIGLSMFEQAEGAVKMREAGASDYLTKSGPSDALLAAIRKHGRA